MIPITTLVHEVARVFGPKPAIISDRWTVSYEELDERINRLANAYRELGLQHGDRFAVMATDSIEHIETALAICRAGGVYVPLNYRLREEATALEIRNIGSRRSLYLNQVESLKSPFG